MNESKEKIDSKAGQRFQKWGEGIPISLDGNPDTGGEGLAVSLDKGSNNW